MLVERQGDVELIDPIALQDVAGLGQRPEQRQAAIADVVAAGLVVDEADHLVAELVVLEQLVDDHAAQLAGAGDEDALEADALAPAPLQRFADQLARGVGERDVDDEEQAPDQLRHLEGAAVLEVVGDVVGLDVEGGDDAEDDGQDAADEDGEEVVDAGAAAAQPVDALDLEGERHEHADQRQDVEVLGERRVALRRLDEAGVEAQDVGQHERDHPEQRVGQDEERDEQAVPPLHHRATSPAGASTSASISAAMAVRKRSRENCSAWARMRAGSNARPLVDAVADPAHGVGPGVRRGAVDQDARFAVDHRLERAAAGQRDDRPAAGLRLDGDDPEILFAREEHGGGAAIELTHVFIGRSAQELHFGTRQGLEAGPVGALSGDFQGESGTASRVDRDVETLVGDEGGDHE